MFPKWRTITGLAISLFCLTVVIKLKIFYNFEVNIVKLIPSFQGLTLTLMLLITSLADFFVTLIIIGCLIIYELALTRRVSKVTLKLLLAFIFVTFLTLTFKILIKVERPEGSTLTSTLPNILSFVEEYSYPSGHVARFTVLMWYFYEKLNKKFIPVILLTLVSLTRLVLHAHYPTDLVGGVLLGLLSYLIVDYFLWKIRFKANF